MNTPKQGGGWHSIGYTLEMARKAGPRRLFQAMNTKNACKTCALGMGGQKGALRNEAGHWPEFCKKSLQAIVADLQPPIPDAFFRENDIATLRRLSSRQLESLGRLSKPLIKRQGAHHYQPISWQEAMEHLTTCMQQIDPQEAFFYFSGRSSNEAAFLLGLLARAYGSPHIHNCSYYCHQASGVGLEAAIGTGTATIQLEDLEICDLFFLIGANPASNHPRLMTSLMKLVNRGGKVIVINPLMETGLNRFSIPSNLKSLLQGTQISHLYLQPHVGGDQALLTAIAKVLIEDLQAHDAQFIHASTLGYEAFRDQLKQTSLSELARQAGVSQKEIYQAALLFAEAKATIFAWAMGITHHLHGVQNVKAICNLALTRGMVGKPGAGLMPIRGHSNVQGIGSMGIKPELAADVMKRLEAKVLKAPQTKGLDTMGCMEAAARSELKLAFCLGGNLYGSNPDATFAEKAMGQLKHAIYLSTTLNTGHTHGLGEETMILPVKARDEEEQCTTQESLFNFVRVSDGGPERFQGPRSEVDLIAELGQRLMPDHPQLPFHELQNHDRIRALIAETIPAYKDIFKAVKEKKEFYVQGRHIVDQTFPTPSGKAQFSTMPLPDLNFDREHQFKLISNRSEGQFNTVVYEDEDRYRGIERRDVVLMNHHDMNRLGFIKGQKVQVKGPAGTLSPIEVRPFNIKKGAVMMYYPEVNQIIGRQVDPDSQTPAFKAVLVEIKPSASNSHEPSAGVAL